MAVLYISEFSSLPQISGGQPQCAPYPPVARQTVAIGVSSVSSSAFNAQTKFIRVHTDAICSVDIGAGPVATATTDRLGAGQTEYFGVTGGHKIAVITNT